MPQCVLYLFNDCEIHMADAIIIIAIIILIFKWGSWTPDKSYNFLKITQ